MKIIAGSDIHGLLVNPEDMPQGDVLCLCGDIVPLEYQNSLIKSVSWFLLDFVPWVDALPYQKVIFIGGNHDFFLENIHKRPSAVNDTGFMWRSPSDVLKHLLAGNNKGKHNKLVYLCDNSYEYDGVKFYGTPWIGDLKTWAFYADSETLTQKYSNISNHCNVLLTHMPPDIADCGTVMQSGWGYLNNYGSRELAAVISSKSINYALCGHVHTGNHHPTTVNGTTFINVSIKDENYKRNYDWTEIELKK